MRTIASRIALALLLACPGPVARSAGDGPEPKPPNVVFILADDLGWGDLGCYGQQTLRTPNLDRLAAEGMRFTQVYAGSTVCAPSRCVLMTGYHTGHARIRGNARDPLLPEDVTVAEALKAAGYHTALIGKWGLGEDGSTGVPNRQGFDDFFGYLNQGLAHNSYPDFLWRQEERVEIPGNVIGPEKNVAVERGTYSHDLFVEEALAWVDRHRDGPFFLYLALTIPHANNEASRATGNGMEVPDLGAFAEEDWPETEKGKAAMIARMDADIGRLMAKLDELGIDDDTIVFFTSDNGPHREGGRDFDPEFFDSNGPLRGIKRDLYEGGIRVPMLVRWPGHIPAGAVSDQVWAFWDVPPTLAELAGPEAVAALPDDLDGLSVVPSLIGPEAAGRTQEEHEFLYWEFHEGRASKQAVRMGRWKGVRLAPDGPLELYDLETDLGEEKDQAAEHPEIVARIEAYLSIARTESPAWPLRGLSKD
ncbi:arylsulfatase [Tautonia sociabilis]|uniref:N-acetylgalactosamine-6-sulfatase n=1 Tax=Tautonia sociabilis TaxID=2080755 RepID=A0A432MMH9_9BACT|nr:arylsulfatase [Tautonia sociabilis]RUL88315.1 N-acetylgalactosamine-6-sulfatase [Tautonia sociabilis]